MRTSTAILEGPPVPHRSQARVGPCRGRGPTPQQGRRWLPCRGEYAAPPWFPTDLSSPLDEKLGIEIVDWDPDRLVARMPVAGNTQPFGLLHGGATCALVEAVGSFAAALGAGPDGQVVGIELNASYHRAATSGHVTAVCRPARRGRTLATFLIEVSDDAGELTCSARLSCLVRQGR